MEVFIMKKSTRNLIIGSLVVEGIVEACIHKYLNSCKIAEVDGIGIHKISKDIMEVLHCEVACATNIGLKSVIFVDERFDAIRKHDASVAEFIIAHELGHIKLGHTKPTMKDTLKLLLTGKRPGRNIQSEIDADTWAINLAKERHCSITSCINDGIKLMNMCKHSEETDARVNNLYHLYSDMRKEVM
jgi:hypothetical protein